MSWDRFWHRESSTLWLCLFRVLFAGCLLRELSTTKAKAIATIASGKIELPVFSWLPHVSAGHYELLHWLQIPLIAWLAIGWRHRIPAAGLLICQGWVFFGDYMNFRNHPYFFWLVTLILLVAPAGETLSPKTWARRKAGQSWRDALIGPYRPVTMQRLIQLQMSAVYLFAAVHKLNPSYLQGEVMARYLSAAAERGNAGLYKLIGEANSERLADWMAVPSNMVPVSIASIATELLLPLLLWWPRLRPIGFVVGIGFHLMIAETMGIRVFSWAMIGGYLLFLPPLRRRDSSLTK